MDESVGTIFSDLFYWAPLCQPGLHYCIYINCCFVAAWLAMTLRNNFQRFQRWSVDNKFKSLVVIVGFIYVVTLPLVRHSPATAVERAVNPEIRREIRNS